MGHSRQIERFDQIMSLHVQRLELVCKKVLVPGRPLIAALVDKIERRGQACWIGPQY